MNLQLPKLKSSILELCKPAHVPHTILGLSGGPDSVFLFHVLRTLRDEGKINLTAAHLDHGWREEAKRDRAFCQKLCNAYRIPLIISGSKEIISSRWSTSSREQAGRHLRRTFFKKVLNQVGGDVIALAHHLDDQEETFLWRIMRGSSLAGLTCMKPREGIYIRPLLNMNKTHILEYLGEHNLPYCTDESNESSAYLRNRIRKVIPALRACDERFDKKFLSTLTTLQEEHAELTHQAQKHLDALTQKKPNGMYILDVKGFRLLSRVLQRRTLLSWLIMQDISFSPSNSFLNEVISFLTSPRGGKHRLGDTWILCKRSNESWVER